MLILNDLPGFEKYFLDNIPVEREMAITKFETIILVLGALSIKLMCKSTRFLAVLKETPLLAYGGSNDKDQRSNSCGNLFRHV